MNTKTIAIVVVVIVVIAAIATAVVVMDDDDDSDEATYQSGAYNVVARVNSEGSGLFIKNSDVTEQNGILYRNGTPFYSVNGDVYTVSTSNANAWGGLVFATPGTTSIQHTQMASLAQSLGLGFRLYQSGQSLSSSNIYYYTNLSNFSLITSDDVKGVIDGGIIWEPQYQRVIQEASDTFRPLALTNNLFPGHTCCIIVGSHSFLERNADAAERFLAGYAKAVDFVNTTIAAGSGSDYDWLVNFTATQASLNTAEVEAAFKNITYLYADNSSGSLDALEGDIANLITSLDSLNAITGEYKDAAALADEFVDDSYLEDAIKGDFSTSGSVSVTVATITGDIHQIALHVAVEKGFFSDYNLTVNLSQGANGGAIAAAMQNGTADFGFLGAPPATITTINAGLITV